MHVEKVRSQKRISLPDGFCPLNCEHWYAIAKKMEEHDVVMLRSPELWHSDVPRSCVAMDKLEVIGAMRRTAETVSGYRFEVKGEFRTAVLGLLRGLKSVAGDRSELAGALYERNSFRFSFRIPATDFAPVVSPTEMP